MTSGKSRVRLIRAPEHLDAIIVLNDNAVVSIVLVDPLCDEGICCTPCRVSRQTAVFVVRNTVRDGSVSIFHVEILQSGITVGLMDEGCMYEG